MRRLMLNPADAAQSEAGERAAANEATSSAVVPRADLSAGFVLDSFGVFEYSLTLSRL